MKFANKTSRPPERSLTLEFLDPNESMNAAIFWRAFVILASVMCQSASSAFLLDDAEVEAIALLISLAEEFQTPIHIVHLSSAQALPLLRDARERGVPVTVETCAHYLWFEAAMIPDGATQYKCAPPIRDARNREALWNALNEGLIDMVTTDHSPCPPEMKRGKSKKWNRPLGSGVGRNRKPWPGPARAVDRTEQRRASRWSGSENGWRLRLPCWQG